MEEGYGFNAWKHAEACARHAERQVAEMWDRFDQGAGPMPPNWLIQETARLRAVANDKLIAAFTALGAQRRITEKGPTEGRA